MEMEKPCWGSLNSLRVVEVVLLVLAALAVLGSPKDATIGAASAVVAVLIHWRRVAVVFVEVEEVVAVGVGIVYAFTEDTSSTTSRKDAARAKGEEAE